MQHDSVSQRYSCTPSCMHERLRDLSKSADTLDENKRLMQRGDIVALHASTDYKVVLLTILYAHIVARVPEQSHDEVLLADIVVRLLEQC